MSAMSEDPNEPVILREKSPYQLVRAANLGRPAGVTTTGEFHELREEEIAGIPGADWLYQDYTERHLLYLRAGHTIFYLIELTMFVIGVTMSGDAYLSTAHDTITPFMLHPKFVFAAWVALLVLEALFIFVIFHRTLTTVELLAKQLSWYYFPKYFLLWAYFYFQYTSGFQEAVINICILVVLYPLIHFVYHRVKYQDDGRFLVSWSELLAVQVNISFYAAWIQSRVLHEVFVIISYVNTSRKENLLGWSNSNWSVLANVLIFSIGVIYLSAYKDVFFNLVIIYSYIGIYIEQVNCPPDSEGNCSAEITKTVVVLGVILSLFVLLVLALYHNQILYRRRS